MSEDVLRLKSTDRKYPGDRKGMVAFLCGGIVLCLALSIVPLSFILQGSSGTNMVVGGLCILLLAGFACTLLLLLVDVLRRLEDARLRDSVSGSISYGAFLEKAKAILEKEKGGVRRIIVYCDLERFKLINDSYGYQTGDELLRRITTILDANLDSDELFCRAYADRFILLLKAGSRDEIVGRLQKIHEECPSLPQESAGCSWQISIRFGIYEIKDWTMDVRTMAERANIACHESDDTNLCLAFYDESSLQSMLLEQNIETSMEHALDKRQFLLYLQPKYMLASGKLCGAEALVRWSHPSLGLLLPDQFLPTFERTGFIRKIDLYMFERVCATMRRWLDTGWEVFPVSVNLSRSHLDDLGLVPVLASLVRYYGIPCNLLELEITENSFRDDEAGMLRMLTELKAEGFSVAMDDFGTGFSTLNILKDIPLDTLKLDKGFLDECVESERGRSVITDVVTMAQHLRMHVICEGIETESQYMFLKDIGCEMGQGFYFAKPLSVSDFEAQAGGAFHASDPQLTMFDDVPSESVYNPAPSVLAGAPGMSASSV